MKDNDLDDDVPAPIGKLALQTLAMPADTNANGDIFGGWLVSQMDLAAAIAALEVAKGRVATVAIKDMVFLTPVHVGAVVSCFADIIEVGQSSIRINIDVWIKHKITRQSTKVTEAEFVFVALDDNGKTRAIGR
jgi:acyl-CoA thioesterase YciA